MREIVLILILSDLLLLHHSGLVDVIDLVVQAAHHPIDLRYVSVAPDILFDGALLNVPVHLFVDTLCVKIAGLGTHIIIDLRAV